MRNKTKPVKPYTIQQCMSCSKMHKRLFQSDDYIFKSISKCDACDTGQVIILRIFGKVIL
ncbi:MAG: hypothetical protein R1F52_06620 [Candidatus Nitrosoabyssus spongiisocia]|nr:MAG: hypothetical protein R1F52_06620 [Nitrosopumilaceae archaeon AB1(1)]